MSTLGWIAIGVAAWLVVAAVVGVLIGGTIRRRDRQLPSDTPAPPVPDIPDIPVQSGAALPSTPPAADPGRPRRP